MNLFQAIRFVTCHVTWHVTFYRYRDLLQVSWPQGAVGKSEGSVLWSTSWVRAAGGSGWKKPTAAGTVQHPLRQGQHYVYCVCRNPCSGCGWCMVLFCISPSLRVELFQEYLAEPFVVNFFHHLIIVLCTSLCRPRKS